jgi:phosphatidylserine/phosphatidylglycerophosphate/cardiolipin synthase-like enzyme
VAPPPDWASLANPADLELVAQALDDGRLAPGRDAVAALQALGLGDVGEARRFIATAPARDAAALAWALRRVAAERRTAADRLARSAQLVWSGPSEGHGGLRDTRAVLDEVCARAERHVLVATYVVYDGLRSLAALARRMRERPALAVDLYVHLEPPAHGEVDEARAAAGWVRRFRERHWPEDVRVPAVWYDPATLDRSAGVSLHAKCVVVDGRHAFVTSANFTEAAQARNIEVGVLLDHPALAQGLVGQFQALRDHGQFRRMAGT